MNETKIHLARPQKFAYVKKMIESGIKEFRMPKSTLERMPKKTLKLIKESGGNIIVENSAGRPIKLDLEKILEVVEMHRDNRTYREIEKITGIPKSTCHYLIKYAERKKIKKGKKIIYL
jgi:hypothetical protein